MTNYAFRYIEEENLIASESIAHLEEIFKLPIDEALQPTDDELDEEFDPGLDP